MFPSAASRCHTAQPPHNLLSSLPYWFVPLAMITGSKGQDVYGGGSLGLWPTINTLGLWSTSFFLLKTVFYKRSRLTCDCQPGKAWEQNSFPRTNSIFFFIDISGPYLLLLMGPEEMSMEDWMLLGRFVPWQSMVNHSWL